DFWNVAPTALGFPPMALLCLVGLTIELHPRAGGLCELDVELTAAWNRPVDAILDARHPTPRVKVSFKDRHFESGHLHSVFSDGWLVIAGRRVSGRRRTRRGATFRLRRRGACVRRRLLDARRRRRFRFGHTRQVRNLCGGYLQTEKCADQ